MGAAQTALEDTNGKSAHHSIELDIMATGLSPRFTSRNSVVDLVHTSSSLMKDRLPDPHA
jgi:hypothetical protein